MKKVLIGISGFLVLLAVIFFLTSNQTVKTGKAAKTAASPKKIQQTPAQKEESKTNTANTNNQTQSGSSTGGQNPNQQGKNTVNTNNENLVVAEYQPKFQQLNNTADKRVDNLIEQAKKEVKDKKENQVDVEGIPAKYTGILKRSEETTKIQFSQLYNQFQEEMTKKKLTSPAGESFQAEYQTKQAIRDQKLQEELNKLIK